MLRLLPLAPLAPRLVRVRVRVRARARVRVRVRARVRVRVRVRNIGLGSRHALICRSCSAFALSNACEIHGRYRRDAGEI